MLRTPQIRAIIAAALFTAAVRAQVSAPSTLPPTSPTATTVGPLSATAPIVDAATRAHRAEIRYMDGQLTVNANNSGLNAILKQIALLTGMRITGGVRDERVYGHYGPAAPADILLTLLDGTGTNVLLRQTDTEAPLELILTPQNGGVTPPNPNAPGFDDPPDEPAPPPVRPQPAQQPFSQPLPSNANPNIAPVATLPDSPSGVPTISQPFNRVLGSPTNTTPTASQLPNVNSQPIDTIPTPSTATPPAQGIVDSTNPVGPSNIGQTAPGSVTTPVSPTQGISPVASPAAPPENPPAATTPAPGSTTPTTPATPEQIFEQLQKLRQQTPQPPQ